MRKNRRDDSTILLVEDDDLNRKLLHQLLQSRGYRVIEAVNGLVALELAKRERPALILMDIDLPGLDGIGLTPPIREDAALRRPPIFLGQAFTSPKIPPA